MRFLTLRPVLRRLVQVMTSLSPPDDTATGLSTGHQDRARKAWSTWLDDAHALAQTRQPAMSMAGARRTSSAEALTVCRRTAELLQQAASKARRQVEEGQRTLHAKLLLLELTELTAQAVELLPDPAYPDLPPGFGVDGSDPLDLARRAEALTASLPIEQFPPGMSQFVVRLSDAIRVSS